VRRSNQGKAILGEEDAVDAAREQSNEIGFAQGKRQPAVIRAVAHEHVEGIKLCPIVVLAQKSAAKKTYCSDCTVRAGRSG
jgi:hypothetical protein